MLIHDSWFENVLANLDHKIASEPISQIRIK